MFYLFRVMVSLFIILFFKSMLLSFFIFLGNFFYTFNEMFHFLIISAYFVKPLKIMIFCINATWNNSFINIAIQVFWMTTHIFFKSPYTFTKNKFINTLKIIRILSKEKTKTCCHQMTNNDLLI